MKDAQGKDRCDWCRGRFWFWHGRYRADLGAVGRGIVHSRCIGPAARYALASRRA